MQLRLCTVLLLMPLAHSCKDMATEAGGDATWAVFFLRDTSLTADAVRDLPLETLGMETVPFLSVKDVERSHWGSHTIEFTMNGSRFLDSLARTPGHSRGKPFVDAVGTERVYLATLWWAYSSSMPLCPYIMVPGVEWSIRLSPLYQGEDPRRDARVYASLKRCGVLVE